MHLSPGLIFTASGRTGDVDHPCILRTDDFAEDVQITVNITDYRNVVGARVYIPAGTSLSPQFTVLKDSTIHYAYATRVDRRELEGALDDMRTKLYGQCDQQWLGHFRLELFESEDTPPRVVSFCEDLDW